MAGFMPSATFVAQGRRGWPGWGAATLPPSLMESHLGVERKSRKDKSRGACTSAIAAGLAVLLWGCVGTARGQQPSPKIWDVQLGAPVSELPDDDFVDPACGTNGGPPGLPIGTFEQFEKCRAEPSGLREVWF